MDPITCYRCGRQLAPDRVDLERWVAIHAWDDGAGLFVGTVRPKARLKIARRLAEGAEKEGA